MSALARLLILAVAALPNSQTRHPDAVEIFNCDFGKQWDVNYDGWPDKWQRHFGAGLPHYIAAAIEEDETAVSGRCLTVSVDGGGAYIEGPCVAVSDNFSYKIEASVRLQGVKNSRARIRVEFCDEEKQALQRATSEWLTANEPWTTLHIGPVNPSDERIRLARVILQVEAGDHPDLSGRVSLDEVWLARMPKMTVHTNSSFNVYTDKDDIEVSCDLSGILDSDPDILFELLDASSQRIEDNRVQLEGRLITERRNKASDFIDSEANQRAAYAGSTSWRPPIRKHGFYRVRVTMQTGEGLLKREVVNIALVPPLERQRNGEFGWSLGPDAPMSFDDLTTLLPRAGVNWVKIPVWYGESEADRGDQLVVLAEKLAAKDIEVVGVLDRPPSDSELASKLSSDVAIADALSTDPAVWLPLLDPVLTRLSLRVRWWQIGADYDCSFASLGNAERDVLRLREQLFRYGQEVNVGIGWKWNQISPVRPEPTWEFQQLVATPALTGDELGEYLKLPARKDVSRWVLIESLSRQEYDLQTRARDLVEQMLAAKIQGADAIFAAQPFSDDTGLMTSAGAPGELLLPWRTTASLLSAAKFLGTISLPHGSHNRVFETPQGDVLMVVWSDRPTREVIELGDSVRVLDVWGREQLPAAEGARQVIEVETLPKFVLGLNSPIARWRMEAKFASGRVPSVFGKPHPNQLTVRNTFAQGVGGYVEFSAPKGWQVSPQKVEFKLGANETAALDFDALLPFDAASGTAPIRADFVIDAERQYRFSQFLELNVGDGEVELETSTRLEDDGTLVVEQRMLNHSSKIVDFKCLLVAPGRRQQRAQVFQLGGNPDVKVYRFPNGDELVGGELWLRAKEVNGDRVINHRFIVEQ